MFQLEIKSSFLVPLGKICKEIKSLIRLKWEFPLFSKFKHLLEGGVNENLTITANRNLLEKPSIDALSGNLRNI